jgi:type I restriction enzyme S subunit
MGQVVTINPDAIGRNWPHPHIRYIDISSVGIGQIEVPPQHMMLSEAPSRAKRLVRKGDTVLSTVRPNRRSMFFASQPGDDWVVSTGFAVLRPNAQLVDPRFLYVCVFDQAFTDYLITREKGAAYPAVSPEDIANAEIMLPPLKEQQAIACILGTLDDKIELNRRRCRTLEALARAIFQSWFVDFDPVKAKAAGRTPPGLSPEIAELFPDRFEDSPLGPIPAGWRVSKLNALCRVGRGSSPRPIHDFMGGTVPWIKIADATSAGGPFIYETKEFVSEAGAQKSVWVKPGDLILSNSATCGVPIFVGLHGCIHDGWLHFSDLREITKGYLYHWLTTIAAHLIHIADGSVQKNLNTALVGGQELVIPPSEIVQAFDNVNEPIYQTIDKSIQESRTLAALRDALLPKLISGELRVPDAERIVGRIL